jgi:hypothetical protein
MPDFSPGSPNQGQPSHSLELRSDVTTGGRPTPSWWTGNKKKGIIAGLVVLAIIIGGLGYAAWQGGNETGADDKGFFGNLPSSDDREEEPTTTSGLSGVACAHPDRRPVGVMLAGDPINRPMSGFSKADMVWELPVLTSNVTRLLAVYQCGEPNDIGSVRSARHDYLFLADGVDAIVGHWGGSYHALNRIAAGEFQTLNALTNPHNAYFRKNHLPAPYNGFTTYDRLWNAVVKLGYRTVTKFEGYEFKDDAPQGERGAGGTLTIAWPGAFRVHYEYDPATNRYVRFWAGTKQVDFEDKEPVQPSVVAIMRAANNLANGPGGYNDVGIEGEGALEVYQDGGVINGMWTKNPKDPKDPVHFLNEQGQPITFTRGQLWVMTPDTSIPVTWEPTIAGTTTSAPTP